MRLHASILSALVLIPLGSALAKPPLLAQQAAKVSKAQASDQGAASAKADPADLLRGFTSYYIKSDTVYLHRETLLKELQQRGEFSAWGLTPAGNPQSADVIITITLPFLSWEWNYKMVHQPTGAVLGTGKVSAAVEKTAAPQLAAIIVKHIHEARPLPASFQEAQGAPQVSPNSGPEKEKSWRGKYSGPERSREGTPVTITVRSEKIIVRDSKKFSLTIPVANVRTADSRTQIHKATKDWEDFWDHNCCGDNGAAAALFLAPVVLGGWAILAPIKTTDHFVSLYWLEDGSMRGVEFRVSAGDTKSLLDELHKVTGRNSEDLQQASTERGRVIDEQYAASPIVEIKSPVKLGWNTLWPGHYHMIIVPRTGPGESDLADVYFFAANKPTPDILSGDAVAEFERQKAPLDSNAPPSITYHEQNGIQTFDQIETDQFVLRFTPIPLGFTK